MLHDLKAQVITLCQPVLDFCTSLGEPGLFILAFMESSFFPIPPDFIYIPMLLNGAPKPYLLALICTVGSVLGALFGYAIGKYGGRPLAERMFKHDLIDKADAMFDRYGSMAVLIAAFTPVPYKVFTIAAGMSNMKKRPFVFYSILGRGGRFFVVTFLLIEFGQAIMENFFKFTLVIVAVLLLALLAALFKAKSKKI